MSEAAVGLPCLSRAAVLCHSNSLCHNVFPQTIPAALALPRALCAGGISPLISGTQPKAELSAASKEGVLGEPLRVRRAQGREEGRVPGARMQVSISP